MDTLIKYFPHLSARQRDQLAGLGPAYRYWNERINLISRRDIDNLYLHHILHSLAIAKVISFQAGAEILDLGTGGGLPGIPLAILFPETRFTLIDGTGKKINVVKAICQKVAIENIIARHQRAETVTDTFDFVLSRAVAGLDKLLAWSTPLLKASDRHAMPNGLFALKGGNVREELKKLPGKPYSEVFPLHDLFAEPFFKTKCLVYVQP